MTLDEPLPTTNPQDGAVIAVTSQNSQIQQVDGYWEKVCSSCGEWIGLGPKGSEHPFIAHQGSKRCRRTMEWKIHQQAKAALESFVPPVSQIPPPLSASSHILTAHPSLTSGPSYESGNQEILLSPSSPVLLDPSALPPSPTILSWRSSLPRRYA